MKKVLRISLVFSALVLLGISAVWAEIIDFDGVNFAGKDFLELGSYSEDGFNINGTLDIGNFLLIPGADNTYFFETPDLIIQHSDESAILSSQSGDLFNLNSVVLRGVLGGEQTASFSAFDSANNLKGAQNFTFSDTNNPHTLNFGADFQNIASVRWLQTDQYYAVDNIDLAPNVVPEPVSLLLYGLGGVTLAAFRGRRKKEGSR